MVRIPLLRPHFNSDELDEIQSVLDSGWVSQGPEVKTFEDMVANYLGIEHAIAVTNCTSALHLSLLSIGISQNDEVLVADYTFPATAHAVLYCGAKPIFVDVNPSTYNMDPEKIHEKISDRTKAIIPVHTFGHPAEMDRITKIAREHELKVIEDAACALGAKYQGKYAGAIGNIGCFSFHARKGITTGEGGMIVSNDDAYSKKARCLSTFGMTAAWEREKTDKLIIPKFNDVGFNYKMSDITAAVGVVQMKKLEAIVKRKQDLAKYWGEKLEEIELIEAPNVAKGAMHIYQSYVAIVDKAINRNKLIEIMAKKGVQTQIGTYSCHIQPVYKSNDNCPCSLRIFETAIALPIYYTLNENDIDLAADILKQSMDELK